jgi:hypothetical protein
VVQTCEGKSLRRSQGGFTPCRLGSRDVRKNISCDLSDRQFFVFGARNTTLAWMFSRPLPDRHTALYEWQCCLGFVFRIVISVFLILLVASSACWAGGRETSGRVWIASGFVLFRACFYLAICFATRVSLPKWSHRGVLWNSLILEKESITKQPRAELVMVQPRFQMKRGWVQPRAGLLRARPLFYPKIPGF